MQSAKEMTPEMSSHVFEEKLGEGLVGSALGLHAIPKVHHLTPAGALLNTRGA